MADERVSLAVLVPVFNEQHLVSKSLDRLKILTTSAHLDRVEVIVVDDGSQDNTALELEAFKAQQEREPTPRFAWTFLTHAQNLGKGGAVSTALMHATCEISVIHDADLEYHPKDLHRLTEVFVQEKADAVFGSRFAGGDIRRVLNYRHQIGNSVLTWLCNLVTNLNLTDMETCYKAVRTELLKSIPIESKDFRIEPELTIKLAKRRARIYEVPISYSGRTYAEGKKISWRDGFRALGAIVRYAVSDNIYERDAYGSQILGRLSHAGKYNRWLADTIRRFCGNRLLEIGSGVGNITKHLIPRWEYVVSDINPLYLRTLGALADDRPYLRVTHCDVTDLRTFPTTPGGYDTVVCMNVIEHIEDDRAALLNIKSVLADEGRAIILVPQGEWNFGTLDEVLGHKRRYSKGSLRRLAEGCGFEVSELMELNRVGTLAWFLNGRVMRRRTFGLLQVWMLNWLTPVLRVVDRFLPFPGLSLIGVLGRRGMRAS